jgi:hypothetical protein
MHADGLGELELDGPGIDRRFGLLCKSGPATAAGFIINTLQPGLGKL